jgi:hypothetical protein
MEKEFKNEAAIILLGVISEFPGLIDKKSEVCGTHLVDFLSACIHTMTPDSKKFAEIVTDCMQG